MSGHSPATYDTARLFEEHRGFLWRLSYRLTGNAADADDILQETFVRAMVKPVSYTHLTLPTILRV